jgi:hypothetical protein
VKFPFGFGTFSVWTQFSVRVRVRVRVAACAAVAFSVWTAVAVPTGKNSTCTCRLPRGMPLVLVTRMQELQANRRGKPMASSSVNFAIKKRTVPQVPPLQGETL